MIYHYTPIPGVFLIESERHEDARGWFSRTYCAKEFSDMGLETNFAQCSTSFNEMRGTLRGLHYQADPCSETKLVRCAHGYKRWSRILKSFTRSAHRIRRIMPAAFAGMFPAWISTGHWPTQSFQNKTANCRFWPITPTKAKPQAVTRSKSSPKMRQAPKPRHMVNEFQTVSGRGFDPGRVTPESIWTTV